MRTRKLKKMLTSSKNRFFTIFLYLIVSFLLSHDPVNAQFDLAVKKSYSPDTPIVGQPITYTVGVTVTAPAPAVMLTDTIQFTGPFTLTVDPQLICDPMSGTAVTTTLKQIICYAYQGLPISSPVQLTLVALPMSPGWVTNTVEATSSDREDNTANNRDAVTLLVEEEKKAPIPTIGGWGIAMMIILGGLISVAFLRRRRDMMKDRSRT